MTKTTLYHYLGTNGDMLSPIHLEGIYSVKKLQLMADNGKVLTKDGINTFQNVLCAETDEPNWYEIDDPDQNILEDISDNDND